MTVGMKMGHECNGNGEMKQGGFARANNKRVKAGVEGTEAGWDGIGVGIWAGWREEV